MPLSKIEQSSVNSGVAGTGSAFRAYSTNAVSNAIPSSTWTKIPFNATDFNVLSGFDTTNYRFKPTVAGYYQLNGNINLGAPTSSGGYFYLGFFRNGTVYNYSASLKLSTVIVNTDTNIAASTLVYLNGSTDYVELYVYMEGTSQTFGQTSNYTNFSGFLARAT